MSQDTQIFLAPCSREHKTRTYDHFESSVLDGLDTDLHPQLNYSDSDDSISIWGVVSGNEVHWRKLNVGDIILFYTKSGVYTHLAEVVDTEYNERVGDQIWTTYDGKRLVKDLEEPWPFLIYLSNVQRVDIPAEDVHNALGYDMNYPQGFMRPTEARHEELKEQFGSVQEFVQQYTTRPLSGPVYSVEELIEDLNSKLHEEPELKTTEQLTPAEETIQLSAFRRRVGEIYDHSCAVCGARRMSPSGATEVEATQIYPRERNGSYDLRNGIALCKLHHWALNTGWLAITDDHRIRVKDAQNTQGYQEFRRLTGRGLRMPEQGSAQPHKKFLRAHRNIHQFD